jgi:hypothetical protein
MTVRAIRIFCGIVMIPVADDACGKNQERHQRQQNPEYANGFPHRSYGQSKQVTKPANNNLMEDESKLLPFIKRRRITARRITAGIRRERMRIIYPDWLHSCAVYGVDFSGARNRCRSNRIRFWRWICRPKQESPSIPQVKPRRPALQRNSNGARIARRTHLFAGQLPPLCVGLVSEADD